MTQITFSPALPEQLINWYSAAARDLPWRRDREPYHVWLSEIMLQQTRVEAVKPYYARFLTALPDIASLAAAPEQLLLKLWEGLGYYSRVRNLQKAALMVMEQHGGIFPSSYGDIAALPGIGPYTAGAISSICFDLPTPAVDGNVLRVCARLLEYPQSVDEPAAKKNITAALADIYPVRQPGAFTQSLMELGATVCIPAGAPKCTECPISDICAAYKSQTQLRYPVRTEKKKRKKESRTVFLFYVQDRLALLKRQNKGLLAGLWELPNRSGLLSPQEAAEHASALGLRPAELVQEIQRKHIFTHIEWDMTGYLFRCSCAADAFTWVSPKDLQEAFPLPTAFRQFLENKDATLQMQGK